MDAENQKEESATYHKSVKTRMKILNCQLLHQNSNYKKYLYKKLIEITDEILRTRSNRLEQDIQSISKENKSDWDRLIQ